MAVDDGFNGTLLQFVKNGKYTTFNLDYVFKESYVVTPDRRQDLDSNRNANGVLVRNVVKNMPTTISLTVKTLNQTQMANLMKVIRSNYIKEDEKKVALKYYNPLTNGYEEDYFYIPDIEYTIAQVDVANKTIRYNQFTLEFIGY